MKKWLSYFFYFAATIAVTYAIQLIILFYLSGMRFTAADRSLSGDIGLDAKLVFSVGFPVFHFICLTIVFFLYRSLMKEFGIELKKMLPIWFNTFIALYLIVRFTYFVFD